MTATPGETSVHEVSDGIYRISTPVKIDGGPGAFTFNQYLLADDRPLLFHSGPRRLFPLVRDAVRRVLPVESLCFLGFSHVEADECGALNDWLAAAPRAVPLCGRVAAMTSVEDMADRPPRVLADGEAIDLGRHRLRWFDTPHVPHGWESGLGFEETTKTLLCGDLFTQPGAPEEALTEGDILGPSEAFRRQMDYFAHGRDCGAILERLAAAGPETLACMHGSAWSGDGAALLRELARELAR